MEQKNFTDKCAVCVENNVRILKSKANNRGEGMEEECTLEFPGQRQFINILKENLKD